MKRCSKCGEDKSTRDFCKNKSNKDGLHSYCRLCQSILAKIHYKKNRDYYLEYSRSYYKQTSDKRKENKEAISAKAKTYYHLHREELIKRSQERYYANKENIIKNSTIRYSSPCKTRRYVSKLPVTDSPRMVKGLLVVECMSCGRGFTPTYSQVAKRLAALNGTVEGEANFYCSDSCKLACPLYRFKPGVQIDPRSILAIPKSEAEQTRRCQTDHLKQLQIDECGHNYCDKCGQSSDIVHLHHTAEIYKNGLDSISSAGHMLMCPACHMELHKECA